MGGRNISTYNEIVSSKQEPRKGRLLAENSVVYSRFATYLRHIRSLQNVPSYDWSDVLVEDFLHCYQVRTHALDKLKKDIKSHQKKINRTSGARCQLCGLNADCRTFDHYTPQSQHPEFSIYAPNLMPACFDCNNLKKETWLDGAGDRQILNLYYDILPRAQFLFADANPDSMEIEFRLAQSGNCFGGLESLIRSHFNNLKLLERYQDAAPAEFCEFALTVIEDGVPSAQELLAKKAQNLTVSISPNYWKVALYQAMSQSPDFLENLQYE